MQATKLGFQIPNFTYADVAPAQLFDAVAAQAVAAETSGFDTVFVMDHFCQLPMMGTPDQEMVEAYTLLGALAARTSTARLGTLVTGVTYREPAVLAKVVTALDVISGGRALLGIGAAWFELEHDALGVEFPPLRERYEHLVDALEICRGMFRQPSTTYEGTHHSVKDAYNSPAPINGDIGILIGGQGERKTFRLAAQYANELNMTANFDDVPRKLEALQGHLDDLGRDRSDISVTPLGFLALAETHDAAVEMLSGRLRFMGVDPAILDDRPAAEKLLGRVIYGDPDEVTDQVQRLMALGLDGLVVNMPSAHSTEAVAMAGEVLTRALDG
ncbi:MAG: TIGR03560 family F420-dependent LLM class oxidoreductase [Acidimicrobiales bacterium]